MGKKLHLRCCGSVFEVGESEFTDVRCTNIAQNSASGLQQKSEKFRNAMLALMTVPVEDKHGNRLYTLEASLLTWWYQTQIFIECYKTEIVTCLLSYIYIYLGSAKKMYTHFNERKLYVV